MFQYTRILNNGNSRSNNDLVNSNEIERSNIGFLYNGFTGFGSLDNLKDFDVLDSQPPNHSYSLPNFRFSVETCIPGPVAHLPNTKSAYNMRLQSPQAYKSFEANSEFDNCFGDNLDFINDISSFENISDSTFLQTCVQYSINPTDLDFTPKIFWEKYKLTNQALNNSTDSDNINNNNNNSDSSINFNNIAFNNNLNLSLGDVRFDKIVTDFFRSNEEQSFNFYDKFNNSLQLIKFSNSFIPLVGLDYANDYVIKINVKCFSRLIGIKDGINFLFDQNGAFNQLGLNEITDSEINNFNDHINLDGIDFLNTKLIYHPDKLFAKNSSLGEN